jgi:hypothetical protein
MGQQLSGFFSSEDAFGQREVTLDSETKLVANETLY